MSWFDRHRAVTAKDPRAVRFVAESLAFHHYGAVDRWEEKKSMAEELIQGYAAIKAIESGLVDFDEVYPGYFPQSE